MNILKIPVTSLRQNCRIIVDNDGTTAAIVDPGGDVENILKEIKENSLNIIYVLLTHAHFDHAGGVAKLLSELKILGQSPIFMAHAAEKKMRAEVKLQLRMFGIPDEGFENCPETDKSLEDNEEFFIGKTKVKALWTPGHSIGHLSFFIDNIDSPSVITGDSLFAGSVGRTDLPNGDHKTLINSIKNKLLTLPANTNVMPGHGIDSNIKTEIEQNPYL